MIIWKFNQNLSLAQDHDWQNLVFDTLGEGVHEKRRLGFILSRVALQDCLKEMGFFPRISELKLKDHSALENFPDFTLSLSHSGECGAALLGTKKDYRSLGLDIERKDRVVQELVIERISHPLDLKLRNIELWCAKEAAFKALMNTGMFPKPIEFSSIQIGENQWLHSPSQLSGELSFYTEGSFLIAVALLKS